MIERLFYILIGDAANVPRLLVEHDRIHINGGWIAYAHVSDVIEDYHLYRVHGGGA